MWKLFKTAMFLALVLGIGYTYFLHRDQNMLQEQVIRLHVVADTDDPVDQEIKLRVRDEVLALVDTIKEGAASKEEALQRLKDHLPQLQEAANRVLQEEGRFCQAVVTLTEEEFPTRFYDTFSLPAGIYDSLRVTIGSGEGKNWWCVVFPDLCVPAVSKDVEAEAVSAGFSDTLSKTLTREDGYELRFWLLDCLGRIQNYFRMG